MTTPDLSPGEVTESLDVLLIEDNPGDVRLTREALRESRFASTLHVVEDGEQALEFLLHRGAYADSPRPRLILLDLNLPRLSGRQVLEAIKSNPSLRHIPVVILTTSEADDDIAAAYELSANCYISKPVDLDRFFRVIKAIDDFWLTIVRLPGRERA